MKQFVKLSSKCQRVVVVLVDQYDGYDDDYDADERAPLERARAREHYLPPVTPPPLPGGPYRGRSSIAGRPHAAGEISIIVVVLQWRESKCLLELPTSGGSRELQTGMCIVLAGLGWP